MAGLDAACDMERRGVKYFTIWYGVDPATASLSSPAPGIRQRLC
jgi:hypothetical protein